MRQTSLQAYADLQGTISDRQLLAWVILHREGPLTGQELDKSDGAGRGLWKRLSELKSLGLVEECQPRRCRITGKTALTWKAVVAEPTYAPLDPYFKRPATFYLAVDGGDFVVIGSRDRDHVRRICNEQKLTFVEAKELRRSS